MEFQKSLCLFLTLFSLSLSSSHAYKFFAGGKEGWVTNPKENYTHWAERNRFLINDTIYFKYKKGSDSVLLVNKDDYNNCNTKNPYMIMVSGDSEFTFDRSGPFYFISGNPDHCRLGQKLIVVVLHQIPPLPQAPSPKYPFPGTHPPSQASPPPQAPSPKSPFPGTYPPNQAPTGSSPVPATSPSTSPSSQQPPSTNPPKGYSPAPAPSAYPPKGLSPAPATSPSSSPSSQQPPSANTPKGYSPAPAPSALSPSSQQSPSTNSPKGYSPAPVPSAFPPKGLSPAETSPSSSPPSQQSPSANSPMPPSQQSPPANSPMPAASSPPSPTNPSTPAVATPPPSSESQTTGPSNSSVGATPLSWRMLGVSLALGLILNTFVGVN